MDSSFPEMFRSFAFFLGPLFCSSPPSVPTVSVLSVDPLDGPPAGTRQGHHTQIQRTHASESTGELTVRTAKD